MPCLSGLLTILRSRCSAIDTQWAECGYRIGDFASVVDDLTADLDLTPFGQLENVLPLLEYDDVAELQRLSSFSDLYLKLFDNGRFWVEILNWWGSDINIHDHDFAGVQFQLSGTSLNVGYDFREHDCIDGISLGTIGVQSAEIWRPGDRSLVEPGRKAPHNVCHISVPTVSLLIRTYPDPTFGPQWNYFPPGVAASYGVAEVRFRKHVQGLRLLAKGDGEAFRSAFAYFCSRATPRQLLFALVKMIDVIFKQENAALLDDLIHRGAINESILEAVVFYRAAESIKYVKNTVSLPWDFQLALSIVASGMNRSQFEQIVGFLREQGVDPGFGDPLAKLRSVNSSSAVARLDRTFALFESAA